MAGKQTMQTTNWQQRGTVERLNGLIVKRAARKLGKCKVIGLQTILK